MPVLPLNASTADPRNVKITNGNEKRCGSWIDLGKTINVTEMIRRAVKIRRDTILPIKSFLGFSSSLYPADRDGFTA